MTFDSWMSAVNRALLRRCGLTANDLADWHYRDAFDDGMSPGEVAIEVLEDNDFPFDE